MIFTTAAPRLKGVDIPISVMLERMLALSPFFGAFGLAAGTGLGLLLHGLFKRSSDANPSSRHPME